MVEDANSLSSVPVLAALSQVIDEKPEELLTGNVDLQNAALQATKFIFDLCKYKTVQSETSSKHHIEPLLNSLNPSSAPQTRSQTRKRKRTPSPPPDVKFQTTPLASLFVDGMEDDQIWSQLDIRAKSICEMLQFILEDEPAEDALGQSSDEDEDEEDEETDEEMDSKLEEALFRLKNGEDVNFAELGLDESLKELLLESGSSDEDDSEDEGEMSEEKSEVSGNEEHEEGVALQESSDEEDVETPQSMLDVISRKTSRRGSGDVSGNNEDLDDGFFDLASFNAQTERAEAQKVSAGHLDEDDESDDSASIDFFAPIDDDQVFDEDDLENDASALYYKDFFKPPRQAKNNGKSANTGVRFHDQVRVKNIKPKGKNLPVSAMYEDDEDEEDSDGEDGSDNEDDEDVDGDYSFMDDIQEEGNESGEDTGTEGSEFEEGPIDAITRMKDDLFADDEKDPQQDLTTHEKRMAALQEQISQLEAENVAKKHWVLAGEADSRSRPQNSLLEEDLEFERVMKAVPVITEEVVQGLEERIKARILENRFDDVVRIRPLEDKPFLPSRFFELKDTKSTQSLAQIYEDEYVASRTGGVAGEDRDGKLKKEHEDIEQLWQNICDKLDALCNTHFTPKQPKATISTISNVATATLESALPTTMSAATMLAPEEVFAPKASDLRAKSEMTPAEKQALRRKERKAKKKSRDALNTSVDKYAKAVKRSGLKKQKEEALKSVVKSGKGVTVVGKNKKDLLSKSKGNGRR